MDFTTLSFVRRQQIDFLKNKTVVAQEAPKGEISQTLDKTRWAATERKKHVTRKLCRKGNAPEDKNTTQDEIRFTQTAATSHPMEEPAYEEETDGHSRFMIVPTCILNNNSKTVEVVYVLLDSAADQSFVSATLVRRMQVQVQSETEITVTSSGGRAEKKKVDHANIKLFNNEGNGIDFDF
ncbi:unnamed protein product [Cylicocyclus nassatus]|uniref:Peptidase aspartic putative domain-containing protein n=1 Tax=Cylicocyclus nassatus TaxID=53992 RepID=A0AA36MF44_CYLNA|nr:unnamed protein product [Cylicocyclus nassatus]